MATETKIKRKPLNMRIPEDLLEWTQEYAKKKRKTVTQVVVDHLVQLKEKSDA